MNSLSIVKGELLSAFSNYKRTIDRHDVFVCFDLYKHDLDNYVRRMVITDDKHLNPVVIDNNLYVDSFRGKKFDKVSDIINQFYEPNCRDYVSKIYIFESRCAAVRYLQTGTLEQETVK